MGDERRRRRRSPCPLTRARQSADSATPRSLNHRQRRLAKRARQQRLNVAGPSRVGRARPGLALAIRGEQQRGSAGLRDLALFLAARPSSRLTRSAVKARFNEFRRAGCRTASTSRPVGIGRFSFSGQHASGQARSSPARRGDRHLVRDRRRSDSRSRPTARRARPHPASSACRSRGVHRAQFLDRHGRGLRRGSAVPAVAARDVRGQFAHRRQVGVSSVAASDARLHRRVAAVR